MGTPDDALILTMPNKRHRDARENDRILIAAKSRRTKTSPPGAMGKLHSDDIYARTRFFVRERGEKKRRNKKKGTDT